MVCYIYCKINDRELMVNEDDPEDIKLYSIRWNRWRKSSIHTYPNNYKHIVIGKKKIYLHRLNYYAHNQDWDLFDNSKSNQIDHIDRNPPNNHISNLRVVTNQQNNFNVKCKGYSWCKNMKRWRTRIKIDGKENFLGYFDTEEEARNKYLEAKKIYHNII